MKLIIEEPVKIKGSVELNESRGEKNYYIQGIFATINQQNIMVEYIQDLFGKVLLIHTSII